MHANRTKAKGFTLVEILIVVVILGILAAIVVPQFTNAANEARNGNIATQVSTIENQLELYAAQHNGAYPTAVQLQADWAVMIDGGYLKELPVNPFGGADGGSGVTGFSDWPTDGGTSVSVIEGDTTGGWLYDELTGNIAASGGYTAP